MIYFIVIKCIAFNRALYTVIYDLVIVIKCIMEEVYEEFLGLMGIFGMGI